MEHRVRRSTRARRVSVRVDPRDGGVEVVLPSTAPGRLAAEAVIELAPWIERRRAAARAAQAAVAARGGFVEVLGEPVAVPRDAAGRATFERQLRRRARAEVLPRLDHAARVLDVSPARVRIGDARTRWGSCSSTGTLSFSWRLVLAPTEVLDYVVWHEACHLVVRDHSPRFWALLASVLPGYEAPRRWLRDHGAELVLPATA